MGWFSGVVSGLLFTASSAMFVYSAWRVVTRRESRLLRLSQMAFYAALMLIVLPKESSGLASNWPIYAAFALLLVSMALTIAHKRGRNLPRSDAGAGPESS